MGEKILVCVAWPYCNGDLHVGHIAGAYLPADIFARYNRLKGREVLMVSGSDTHGTPIAVKAEKEGITPREVVDYYHPRFIETFQRLGITFDIFTETDTENHWRITQDMFLKLMEKGYIFKDWMQALFCPSCNRFLADRYVEGTCPYCGYPGARGDQCDACGRTLDAIELINPRCKICGGTPEIRLTEHFFLDLPKLNEPLLRWVEDDKEHWRPNVLNPTLATLRSGELRPRPITRDIEWGIPVPVKGYEHKRIYVWFDAVIGYWAATIEWANIVGKPEAWREWWQDPSVRSYYFIGKDNIPFHTIIWPGMLIGYGDLNLPYDVPANEYLTVERKKLSKSRRWVIEIPDFLSRYDPDPLRYTLTVNAPETGDSDFSWEEFLRCNNNELVATWGNLCYRLLVFAHRYFDGRVPEPGELGAREQEVLRTVEEGFQKVGQLLDACRFRAALTETMALAQLVNRYLNEKEPWKLVKEDRASAAAVIYTGLRAVDSLKVLFYPFIPFSSQEIHRMLGYQDDILGRQYAETIREEHKSHLVLRYDFSGVKIRWEPGKLEPGQPLGEPRIPFKKLDEKIVEEELNRMMALAVEGA